ncbi:MAG: metallophosphoesterase [Firmicutes bacterium]|nr:metallophosphoesterase [Bacillota bacterium]
MIPGLLAGAALAGLWLVWAAGIEPRWLRVRAFRLQPGAGPLPLPPVAAAAPSHISPAVAATPSPTPTSPTPPAGAPTADGGAGRGAVRIAHLTDLHAPVYRIDESRLWSALLAWQPHLIAFTGDLVEDGRLPWDAGLRLLARLADRWPVYFVPGNHDHLAGWPRLEQGLRASGVRVLANAGEPFQAAGYRFFVAGVDDPHTRRDRLDRALTGAPADLPVLLLAHAPAEGLLRQASRRHIPLVLTGHTHGGQVRLPWVGALWVPGQGWFPRYDRGWFPLGRGCLLVNAGLGTPKPWVRWLCPPEVLLIAWQPAPCGSQPLQRQA